MAEQTFIAELIEIIGESNVTQDPKQLQVYGQDWLRDYKPAPLAVARPGSATEVQSVVQLCIKHHIALVPSGGRTGLSGGATATAGELILSLERLNKILEIDSPARLVRCGAGVITQNLQEEVQKHGLYLTVDFASRGSSQIGGNIATNAGGIRVIRYGNIRDWVVGLVVVTGAGELITLNGSLIKNNTGYDLKQLFIGSEGTLGVIVEATLLLSTPPKEYVRALCALKSVDKILPVLEKAGASCPDLSAFEFIESVALEEVLTHCKLRRPFTGKHPYYLLLECESRASDGKVQLTECISAMLEAGNVEEVTLLEDAVMAESIAQSEELMALRDRVSETLSSHYTIHKNDLSVPVSSIPDFITKLHALLAVKYPDFRAAIFGHIGDGNLHVNILKNGTLSDQEFYQKCHQADREIFTLVKDFKGSISAEHGVGLLKRDFLNFSRSEQEIQLMHGIKLVFDPHGIMNPGKILQAASRT